MFEILFFTGGSPGQVGDLVAIYNTEAARYPTQRAKPYNGCSKYNGVCKKTRLGNQWARLVGLDIPIRRIVSLPNPTEVRLAGNAGNRVALNGGRSGCPTLRPCHGEKRGYSHDRHDNDGPGFAPISHSQFPSLCLVLCRDRTVCGESADVNATRGKWGQNTRLKKNDGGASPPSVINAIKSVLPRHPAAGFSLPAVLDRRNCVGHQTHNGDNQTRNKRSHQSHLLPSGDRHTAVQIPLLSKSTT